MTIPGANIPRKLISKVEDRKRLKDEYRNAQSDRGKLSDFERTFQSTASPTAMDGTAADINPGKELNKTLARLSEAQREVDSSKSDIAKYRNEVNEIQSGCLYKVFKQLGLVTITVALGGYILHLIK